MKNIVKKFLHLVIFFSIITLIYVIYRSEFYYGYSQFNYYFKYFLAIGIFLILSIIVSFQKDKFQKRYLLITFSVFISIYLLEGLINLFNIEKKNLYQINQEIKKERISISKKMGINYDLRTKIEYYNERKKKDKDIAIALGTNTYLKKTEINKSALKTIYPLSGLSLRNTILCNENGFWTEYFSDRYGFNNPDEVWDLESLDFVLVGDSFTHGACVNINKQEDFSGLFRQAGYTVLNLGIKGTSTLSEYARIKEYISQKRKVKNLILFFYSGDLKHALKKEVADEILKEYFNKDFSQNLILKQDLIDQISLNEIKLSKEKTENFKVKKIVNKKNYNFISFLKFQKLRSIILIDNFNLKRDLKTDYSNMERILQNISYSLPKTNLYLVCLPNYEETIKRGIFKPETSECNNIKKFSNQSRFKVINIRDDLFLNIKDPKKLYPFGLPGGHYNKFGYKIIVEHILENYFNE
ncbi:hypothetical protein OAQ59_04460 [Candidatus Pelagibacter sp.]|nr:hypothetical protein [Candidatus Pelagibacter sp.]